VASRIAVGLGVALMIAAYTGIGERWTVLPLVFLVFCSLGFMQGNTTAGALNVDPLRAGSISALMGAVGFAAGALASTLAAVLHDGSARPMALVMILALAGSALALRFLALRPAQA
jgi:DHA1 family bicyclomycin/chloramphenicol resistance-like MFS transporter